jgi:hypothetical protein
VPGGQPEVEGQHEVREASEQGDPADCHEGVGSVFSSRRGADAKKKRPFAQTAIPVRKKTIVIGSGRTLPLLQCGGR